MSMAAPQAGRAPKPAADAGVATYVAIAGGALAFRLISAALAFLGHVGFPSADPTSDGNSVFGGTRAFWDIFVRWDSPYYFQIARYGYEFTPEGRSRIAYFPAYPLLIRYVGRLFGRSQPDMYFGAIAISWVAFVLAMIGLYKLARLDVDDRDAKRAVLLAAIFPFAFFYGVVYTESLFLFAVIFAFYCFRTRRWLLGGLFGALVTATRVNGILILPSLAWIAWRNLGPARGGTSRERTMAIVTLLMVPVGIASYSLFIYHLTGDPLEWAKTLERWDYYPGGMPWLAPIRLVRDVVSHPIVFIATTHNAVYDTLNGLIALVFIAAVPVVWIRLGTAYALFMAANLWLPLSSGLFEGLGRYCAVLFPFFICLATVRSRAVMTSAIVGSALLYGVCQAMFTNLQPLY